MAPGFDIDVTRTDAMAVVRVIGELDLATAPHQVRELLGLRKGGVRTVTVGLSGLDFIASTGLTVVVSGLKDLRERGGELALRWPQPPTMRLFEMTGLSTVFSIS